MGWQYQVYFSNKSNFTDLAYVKIFSISDSYWNSVSQMKSS